MTKEEILEHYKDINFMYNHAGKLEELEHDLNEYRDTIIAETLNTIETILEDKIKDLKFDLLDS